MAFRGQILVMFLFTVLWDRTMAQSGCTNALISMAPCLSFVTGSLSSPSSSCCSQLASVVQSQPLCLCTVLGGGGGSLGVTINRTLALELPGACNVQTPPSSRCNAADGPTMSPSESPGALLVNDRPVMSPSGSPVGSPMALSGNTLEDAGSKAVPSAGGGSIPNDAIRITKMPLHQLVLSSLFMASYILTSSRF